MDEQDESEYLVLLCSQLKLRVMEHTLALISRHMRVTLKKPGIHF